MKRLIIALLFTSGSTYALENNQTTSELTDRSNSYISCAFYGDIANGANQPVIIEESDILKFRLTALKIYRQILKIDTIPTEGDEAIISYAEYVASQEAVLWDKPGLNSAKGAQVALELYRDGNCQLLLETIK